MNGKTNSRKADDFSLTTAIGEAMRSQSISKNVIEWKQKKWTETEKAGLEISKFRYNLDITLVVLGVIEVILIAITVILFSIGQSLWSIFLLISTLILFSIVACCFFRFRHEKYLQENIDYLKRYYDDVEKSL